jgi:hypothetical protein
MSAFPTRSRCPAGCLTIALCVALALPPGPSHAQTGLTWSTTFLTRPGSQALFGRSMAVGDFNGDGRDDLAVGAPGWMVNGAPMAGRVCVYYSLVEIRSRCVTQASGTPSQAAEPFDQFGAAVAAGDFNGDGYDDLAVGVPNESFGTLGNTGAVQVFLGGPSLFQSFESSMVFYQGMPFTQGGMPKILGDYLEAGDRFGSALAVGDFDGDRYDDLAVGVPGEDVSPQGIVVPDGGAVHVLYGDSGGLGVTDRTFVQDHLAPQQRPAGTYFEVAEPYDQFGFSLAAGRFDFDDIDDLAIGVPFEDLTRWDQSYHPDAGVAHVLYGSDIGLGTPNQGPRYYRPADLWLQDLLDQYPYNNLDSWANDRFGFAVAAGDMNGDGLDDLAIGVPGENGSRGGVHVLPGGASPMSSGAVFWGHPTFWLLSGDECGRALTFGDFNGDGIDDLAVGLPTDAVSVLTASGWVARPNAGAVWVMSGEIPPAGSAFTRGSTDYRHQNDGGLPALGTDLVESHDRYGYALAAGDFNADGADDLVIGAPNEDLTVSGVVYPDAGAVEIRWGFGWP